jgi:hypothetical protein
MLLGMKRIFCLGWLLLSLPLVQGQNNTATVMAVGNFNPTTYIYLYEHVEPLPTANSNKSAAGGALEYQRWYVPHAAAGIELEANPSDGKLLPTDVARGPYYIWSQLRYELMVLVTQRANVGRFSLFIQEGGGSIVTNGGSNSGWSHDGAFAAGYGIDYHFNARWGAVVGETIYESRQGCYGDPTCQQSWGTTQDAHLGANYSW